MEFTLIYQGPLKPNGRPKDKQSIRRVFHTQLQELVKLPNVAKYGPPPGIVTYNYEPKDIFSKRQVGQFNFAALVNERLHLIAGLNITMLRPEAPGSIVKKGGDIDNLLKTLLDSLKMPKETNEIPRDDSPKEDENPFYCLLEDDSLITKLSIITDRLLEPCEDSSFVNLQVHVETKATELTEDNMALV